MIERGIPRAEYNLSNAQQEIIGQVTSGTQSPSLNTGIGLGFVEKEYATVGTTIYVNIRTKQVAAEVVKLPFYK